MSKLRRLEFEDMRLGRRLDDAHRRMRSWRVLSDSAYLRLSRRCRALEGKWRAQAKRRRRQQPLTRQQKVVH